MSQRACAAPFLSEMFLSMQRDVIVKVRTLMIKDVKRHMIRRFILVRTEWESSRTKGVLCHELSIEEGDKRCKIRPCRHHACKNRSEPRIARTNAQTCADQRLTSAPIEAYVSHFCREPDLCLNWVRPLRTLYHRL